MLGVRLPEDLEKQLEYVSQISKRTKSSLVKELLLEPKSLEDIEDYYLALEALERHKRTGEKTYSLEEAKKALGLLDGDAD